MPYNTELAERLKNILLGRSAMEEKKMFGGIGWMLNGNMCVGVYQDWLLIRIGEEKAKLVFEELHAKPMDITGKPMKGWAMIAFEGLEEDRELKRFTEIAIEFVGSLPIK